MSNEYVKGKNSGQRRPMSFRLSEYTVQLLREAGNSGLSDAQLVDLCVVSQILPVMRALVLAQTGKVPGATELQEFERSVERARNVLRRDLEQERKRRRVR